MNIIRKIGVAVALLVAVASLSPAAAQGGNIVTSPPVVGIEFKVNTILCDTEDQIADIVSAAYAAGSLDGAAQKLSEYMQLKNERGEPTCLMQPAYGVIVEVIEIPDIESSEGTVKAWIVNFVNPINNLTGSVLWAIPKDSSPPASDAKPPLPAPSPDDRRA